MLLSNQCVDVSWPHRCRHLSVPKGHCNVTDNCDFDMKHIKYPYISTHSLELRASLCLLCKQKCSEGCESADKMSSSLTSVGHYGWDTNIPCRYCGIFFPHQGPHIPCGWSVKLVDIFLAAINLRFDSQYCLSSFIVFLRGGGGNHSRGKKGNTVFWCWPVPSSPDCFLSLWMTSRWKEDELPK